MEEPTSERDEETRRAMENVRKISLWNEGRH